MIHEIKPDVIEASEQYWPDEDLEWLKKHNIYYNKGTFAIKVIDRGKSNPLLQIGIEDDGYLHFKESLKFDAGWADDLKNVLDMAINDQEDDNVRSTT